MPPGRRQAKELSLNPNAPYVYGNLAQIDIAHGDAAVALLNAQQERDPEWKAWALAASAQVASDRARAASALQEFIVTYDQTNPYDVASQYALRKQPDERFEWFQQAWEQHDPQLIQTLRADSFVLPDQHDPRFAVLCKQAGLPPPDQGAPARVSSSVH